MDTERSDAGIGKKTADLCGGFGCVADQRLRFGPGDERPVGSIATVRERFGPDSYWLLRKLRHESTGARVDDQLRPPFANRGEITLREARVRVSQMIQRTVKFDVVQPSLFAAGDAFERADLMEQEQLELVWSNLQIAASVPRAWMRANVNAIFFRKPHASGHACESAGMAAASDIGGSDPPHERARVPGRFAFAKVTV